jgi:hypothetical protein
MVTPASKPMARLGSICVGMMFSWPSVAPAGGDFASRGLTELAHFRAPPGLTYVKRGPSVAQHTCRRRAQMGCSP